MRIFN